MPNLAINSAIKAARAVASSVMGTRATYQRMGVPGDIPVTVTMARTDAEDYDANDHVIQAHLQDWLMSADELPDGVEPASGDALVVDGRRYTLLNPGGGRCWEWSGPDRITRRLHTKDMGVQP